MSRLVPAALAFVLAAGAISGCSPQPEPEDPPQFASEEEAFAAAEETYRAYVDAVNQVDLSDPESFEDVYVWTSGVLNAEERKSFSQMHADGWIVDGTSVILRIDHLSAKADFDEVSLGACVDVTGITLTDGSGASQVSADRPPTQSAAVALMSGESPTGYLVSDITGMALEPPC